MTIRNSIEFEVFGKRALFSDPVMRVGGEKMSYNVPTYQALKGIVESIYWKPSICWIIDSVRIMNPIRTQSQGVKTLKMNTASENDLSIYCYLVDVRYRVRAHFVFNEHRPDLQSDWNEHKHHNIAKRMVQKGGRRDIFLGTRECQGYVVPAEFDSDDKGAYDGVNMALGVMYHGIDYPDETGENMLKVRFWKPDMMDGVVHFVKPEDCTMIREIRAMQPKEFQPEEIRSVDQEWEEVSQ